MDRSPHLWFCTFTTASLSPEFIVSMGPRPHLSFWACKTAWLAPESLVSMSPRLHLSFCAGKTTWLASEILVSLGPSPHLWFLHAKQRLLDQNYKSLFVPDLTYGFCIQKSDFSTRIACLYWIQTSPVILRIQNNVISTRNTSLNGSQPSSVVFACKTTWLASEILVSLGPSPHLLFLHAQQRLLDQNYKSLMVPDLTYVFFAFKRATLAPDLHVSIGPRIHLLFCECKTAWSAQELLVSMDPSPNLWFLHAKQRV